MLRGWSVPQRGELFWGGRNDCMSSIGEQQAQTPLYGECLTKQSLQSYHFHAVLRKG